MERHEFSRTGEVCWTGRLPSGLPVFVYPKPEYGKSYAFFAANYGGMDLRYEQGGVWTDSPAGVAHFLEHKMFDTRAGNALQTLTQGGASPNAFTSAALTGYHFECTEGVEDHLHTLLSFVTEPYFTPESVAKEQGIIGQEIAMIEDDPDWKLYMNLLGGLYAHHPIRVSVAGSRESIARITDQTLYHCYHSFYHPGNMALCVAGPVEPERAFEIAARVVTQEDQGPCRRDYGPAEQSQAHQSRVTERMEVSTPMFLTGFKGPELKRGPDGLRLQLVGQLAGELLCGDGSSLYEQLYESGKINKSFGVSFETYPGISFLAAGGESRDPDGVAKAIREEGARLASGGLEEERFLRTRKAAYGGRVRSLSFEHLCVQTVQGYFGGYTYLDFPELYDAITAEEVADYLRRYVTEEAQSTAILEPAAHS